MLSVCVPVYNTDVRMLARQLLIEASEEEYAIELLFFDDYSRDNFRTINREISGMDGIIYREMKANSGRSAIRNLLGRTAAHPYLLFIDGDSLLTGKDFLKKYITATSSAEVICGGTTYMSEPPEDKTTLLRWIYGKNREQLTAGQRTSGNKSAITANNFLIKRDLFLRYGFREAIQGYGHEDTVLGYDLMKAGIKILHIDNPVIHNGLETSAEYLEKTGKALENLVRISQDIIKEPDFQMESGLLRARNRLKSFKIERMVAGLFRLSGPLLIRNLTGKHPKLVLFDLYRIGYLCLKEIRNPGK